MTATRPPFQHIAGLANFRDLGGYPVASSRPGLVTRSGLVYRAADPSKLTDEGVAALQARRIGHVYDLRSAIEITKHAATVREWSGCLRVFIPVFREDDYSPEALAVRFRNYLGEGSEGFVLAYGEILKDGAESYATILSHLGSPDPSPVMIHCTAGKDRTGVICALILGLCGVADEVIADEYSLTEIGLASMKPAIMENLLKYPGMEGNLAGAERMLGARRENMLATLDMIRERYGSVEDYVLKKCNLSPETVAQIRKNLVVETDADPSPAGAQAQ